MGFCSLARSLTDWFDSNPRENGAQSPLREICVTACSYLGAWLSLGIINRPLLTVGERCCEIVSRKYPTHPSGCHHYEGYNKGQLKTNMQPRNKRCTVLCAFQARDCGWELIRTVGGHRPLLRAASCGSPLSAVETPLYAGNSVQI